MRRQKYTLAPSLRIDSKKRDSSWRRSPEIRWQGLAFAALAACFGCGDTQTTAESDANVTLADAGEQPDSGAGIDASFLDAAIDAGVDAGVVTMPTLPDYLGCERDSDCPVGLGNCITEIPFNLADSDGISSITVQDLFPDLTTAGICTLLCTDNALICDGLELQLGNGPSAKYSCQLITTGSAPYPVGAPGFPIAVDEAALAAGQAFAALCRPPFTLASDHSANLCDACTADAQCGTGDVCWASGIDAAGTDLIPGECLESCQSGADCVQGFSCDELTDDADAALGTFCVPIEKTCGACLDVDGDGRGVGLCSSDAASPTAFDCDDGNADAYFDPLNPTHPFPAFCDEQDFNCNGLSDQVEQLVSEEHCGACNSSCVGAVGADDASAQRQCQAGGVCGFVCDNPLAQIDCDGDPNNGCEVETVDPTKFVYFDDDDDLDGTPDILSTPQSPLFLCEVGDRPLGYSLTNTDCDDTRDDVSGQFGIDNQCDGIDQDCDLAVDEGFTPGSCTSSGLGICGPGTTSCSAGNETCVSNTSPATETCSDVGVDNDCDGNSNDVRNGGSDVNLGASCTASSAVGECRNGAFGCIFGSVVCFSGSPSSDTFGNGIDENCDGIDGDASDTIYVSTSGNDNNNGSPTAPLRTLQIGIDAAQNVGRSTVRVSSGTFTKTDTLTLRFGVKVIGGHNPAAGWQKVASRTIVNISSNAANELPNTQAFNGSVGVDCQEVPIATDGVVNLTDMDIRVHRRTTGNNGEAVVGAWFFRCPYLTFQGVTLTVDSGAGGANGSNGGSGTSAGNGVDGNLGQRGHLLSGGAATTGGSSSCSANGGFGGSGGFSSGITNPSRFGSNGDTGNINDTGGTAGLGGGEPPNNNSGISGGGGASPSSVGGGGIRGPFSTSGPDEAAILSFTKVRDGGKGGDGSNGKGGGGGGGGSAGDGNVFGNFLTSGSSGGSGGGGGCRGRGGDSGKAGGATIGVFVEGNSVSLTGMTISVSNGGVGGRGGNGGAGGSGGIGGTGAQGVDGAGSGGGGGIGGGASGGGGGGGGAGGHCIGVVRFSSGIGVGSPSITVGSHGAGGAASAGGGIGSLQGDSGIAATGSSSGTNILTL